MNILENITFLDKYYFWGLLLIPIIVYFFYKKEKKGINFTYIDEIKKVYKHNGIKFYLKILTLILLLINFIFLLANPQQINVDEKIKKNGIDIVFVLDISGSMDATDLKPSRLESAKSTIIKFLDKLKTDRVGLVIFAGKPFSSIPLTFDYNILKNTISRLTTKNIEQQKAGLSGTNIGDSILLAETLFKKGNENNKDEKKENKKREKVIILLTDGDANVGLDPKIAAKAANSDNVKIYTIGIGSRTGGYVNYRVNGFIQRQKFPPLNSKSLIEIAKITNGQFFRATDNNSLKKIFNYLSKLEKNDIEVEIKKEYKEYYYPFMYSLILLIILFGYLTISDLEFKGNKKKHLDL